MSLEAAIIPLTTWSAGSRQKGTYSACTSTWLMKTRSGAGRQHDAPRGSYHICVSMPHCSNGDQWLSNLTENLALQASPSKHKLCPSFLIWPSLQQSRGMSLHRTQAMTREISPLYQEGWKLLSAGVRAVRSLGQRLSMGIPLSALQYYASKVSRI